MYGFGECHGLSQTAEDWVNAAGSAIIFAPSHHQVDARVG
eukprot:CAMPEP_0115422384 /NCGR_PEP_ID=MMETSP0271-20121206/26745_1 /TAXON_ID=71861 /ORGANISM="Scrippsiella trochoidea, Strain CCMP3099" /LENGTH=39 /DNA_ID= /DNA_START= /DNA_END= /DNA_ORIENTATION=